MYVLYAAVLYAGRFGASWKLYEAAVGSVDA
jgi:hypothetical protein